MHSFNYACNQCYSKVTAEFMLILLLLTYLFYTLIFFYMKFNQRLNQEKMIDLDSMVKLQTDEIKKLNVEIIYLKTANDKLNRKRSYCSIDTDNQFEFPMAESETYILCKLRKNSISNGSAQSIKIDNESSNGDVQEFLWNSNSWRFETGKLRGSLLTFIFKKRAKYIDGVKFHKVLIFCSKQYNRKIQEIQLRFIPSPGDIFSFNF